MRPLNLRGHRDGLMPVSTQMRANAPRSGTPSELTAAHGPAVMPDDIEENPPRMNKPFGKVGSHPGQHTPACLSGERRARLEAVLP